MRSFRRSWVHQKMRSRRSAAAAVITAVPEADRTQAFAAELRTIVNASYVVLARYDQAGSEAELALADDRANPERQSAWLQGERLLQTRTDASIPRLTDAMVALDNLRGVTAVYGVDDHIFGLAIFARPRTFTPDERAAIEATLRPGSELLRRLSTFEGEESAAERTAERALPAQYVLDRDYRVELRWVPPSDGSDDALQNILEISNELPPVVAEAVRDLTQHWTADPQTWQAGISVPMPFMVVRTTPLRSADGSVKIGVAVERYRSRNPLRLAADKFSMSSRELEVLSLVLKGFGTPQIAESLDIAESTAHDHIKRMMLKTRARNRVELAAKTLGWRGA